MTPLKFLHISSPSFFCCINLILTSTLVFRNSAAQEDSAITVNILLIYQEHLSKEIFDHVLEYIARTKLGVNIGEVHRFLSNSTDMAALSEDFCKKLSSVMESDNPPDIAIDLTRTGVKSEAVKALLKSIQIPTIAATFGQEGDIKEWRDLETAQTEYLIQVSPPADILIQAVRSIVDLQIITSNVLLFDEELYEMDHKYKALLLNMPTRHLLTELEEGEKLTAQVVKLIHLDIVNFFIASTTDAISEALARSSSPISEDGPYFSDEFAWYSMSMEDGLPRCTGCLMDNVSIIHLSPAELPKDTKANFFKRRFLEEALNEKSLSLMQIFYFDISLAAIMAVKQMKETEDWQHDISNNTCIDWNITQNNPYPAINLNLLKSFKTTVQDNMMGPYTLKENGKNYPNFKMKIQRLIFNAHAASPHTIQDIGFWNSGLGNKELITLHQDQFNTSQSRLKEHNVRIVFRVVTVIQPPFVSRIPGCKEEGKYTNCFKGYCLDLLKRIQQEMDFYFTIREVKSGYGYMNDKPPHEWNGIVRELQDRKADIGLGAMFVMSERESVIDFTVPYYDLVGISILMSKPKTPTSLFKFLTVLENDVWTCILGAFFLTSVLIWIYDRWSPYSYQNNREKYENDEEKREFTLKECLWFGMTSLTPQGGGEAPKNLSGKLVAATWWLFGFIIIASYTANLAAFLTVTRLGAPILSLDDLVKQYKVQYAPLVNSSAWIYFDRMSKIEDRFHAIWRNISLNDSMSPFERARLDTWEYPVGQKYGKMFEAMKLNTPPKTFSEAVNRVRGINISNPRVEPDEFAFLDEATNLKWQTTISCEFEQKGEEFSRKPYAIAVQKGSPLKESFSHMILKLLNQRYLEQLKEEWWNDPKIKQDCPRDDGQSDGISIHNIGGVFIVIFVGIVMACFTLIFEYWWYRKKGDEEELPDSELNRQQEFTPLALDTVKIRTNFNTQYDTPQGGLPSVEIPW